MKDVIISNNPPIYDGEEEYIFISYSHKDKDFVYEDLWGISEKGFKFWYDDGIVAGEVWNETVNEKIECSNCKLVIFFMSENTIVSPAIRKEMELVKKFNKSFFTVNIFNEDVADILGRALSKKSIKLSDMSLYMDFFHEDIIYMKRNEKDYMNNIAKQCINYGLIANIEVVNIKKSVKKVLIICKNSSFSNSIINGIYDYLSKKENIITDKILIDRSLNRLDCAMEFSRILCENIDVYDGFILRVPEKYNEQLLMYIQRIMKLGKKVVLLDIEINAEKLRDFTLEPSYVGSDFATGGSLLGERIGDIVEKYGIGETRVILFEGPYANASAKTRCDSLYTKLIKTVPYANIVRYNLPSLNANIALDYIKNQADEWKVQRMFSNKVVVLFCGIDNIAVEVMRTMTKNKEKETLVDVLKSAKKLILVGYDGIRDANSEIILKNYGIDFLTVDVVPFKQGVNAGQKIYSLLFEQQNDSRMMTQPELIEFIKFDTERYDNAEDIQFLLHNKKALIFDLDGTIADTETLHWEAYNELLKEYKVHLTATDIQKYIGHSEIQIYDMIKKDFSIDFDNEEFLEERIEMYLKLVEEKGLKPFSFIYDILKKSDAKKALVTSQIPSVVNKLLDLWNLDEYFLQKYRFCCHDGTYNKKEIYQNISTYLEFDYKLNAKSVVLFEDSMHYIKEAQKLGLITVGVEHKYNRNTIQDCDAVLTSCVSRGVFCGLCGLDAVYYSSQKLPEENSKIKISEFSLEIGGPAANAAITYAKLGGDAYLISAIGDSEEGRLIKNKLKDLNVKVIDMASDGKDTKCNVSFIYVNLENGSRTIFSGQSNARISKDADFGDIIKKAGCVLYDGNLPGIEDKMIQYVEYYDKDLIIDAGSYKTGFPECFYRANTVISSETFVDDRDFDVFALQKKYGFEHAAKTRGGDSVQYEESGVLKEVEVPHVKAIDTLGAGDIIHGAYCYFAYVQKLPFDEALKMAAYIASHSVEKKGVVNGLDYAISMLRE